MRGMSALEGALGLRTAAHFYKLNKSRGNSSHKKGRWGTAAASIVESASRVERKLRLRSRASVVGGRWLVVGGRGLG